ncbi:MAG: diacylglycerol kinase family lipid kinase [Lachnospiraceae bacterium]|nr:diacylglycerol kinase family lipid kinase [Lachnospiraceae bacterium]
MRKKMLFVYNPKAGKGQIRSKLADILDIFAKADYEITIYPTQKSGEATQIVEQRDEEYDLIVCSGGDGTLDEVVSGMMNSGIITPLGYIPAGSTNDFAQSHGLPKNMIKAAHIAVEGRDFACDVGRLNKDTFVYVAAFGLFTNVTYETAQDMKNALGHMAYILQGVKSLSVIPSYSMKITYDDQVIEDDFMIGMITNSVSVGGFKGITGKHVKLDDGVFEVTLIKRPKTIKALNDLILSLMNREFDADDMYFFRTDKLVCEAKVPVSWTVDGENGGCHERIEIQNLCKAIKIRVTE